VDKSNTVRSFNMIQKYKNKAGKKSHR